MNDPDCTGGRGVRVRVREMLPLDGYSWVEEEEQSKAVKVSSRRNRPYCDISQPPQCTNPLPGNRR